MAGERPGLNCSAEGDNDCPGVTGLARIRNYFPKHHDEGAVIAAWGEAKLIKHLDGKTELRGGSDHDRAEARERMSLFWHEAVVI